MTVRSWNLTMSASLENRNCYHICVPLVQQVRLSNPTIETEDVSQPSLTIVPLFARSGWLVTVLNQNVLDVRGFLVVLLAILVGFSIAFRVLFAQHSPLCMVELVEDGSLVQECDINPFGSLRRSLIATFELAILGSYDNAILYESDFSFLAALTFVLAITTVLVVALNALISVLADSYARVQENASANRRKEKAEVCERSNTLQLQCMSEYDQFSDCSTFWCSSSLNICH